MIVTTYICDKCKKETHASDLYTLNIEHGVRSAGGTGSIGIGGTCCAVPGFTKHLCATCLNQIFSKE